MEYLDIVNDNDEVVGKASKQDIYAKNLSHRIVHVLVFNDKGELALQKRSKTKSYLPGYWCQSAGGHVQSGETYEQAAEREFEEEIGVKSNLTPVCKQLFVHAGVLKKHVFTFRTCFNGPFRLNPEEVEKVEFFSMDKIKEMIKNKENFHPELLFLLKKHFNIEVKS